MRREQGRVDVNFGIGIVIAIGCILGGYAALGGHLAVLVQPFEFVIIGGSSLGIFIVANQMATIKDCGKAIFEAIADKVPKPRDFLDVLTVLHALMRELRARSRSEVEGHFDNPDESPIFSPFPTLLANRDLVVFICDYCRLIIIGNAKPHEIEALMDEELDTLAYDRFKPVHALQAVADGLPGRRDMSVVASTMLILTRNGQGRVALIMPQSLLKALRYELAEKTTENLSADPRWARQIEASVSRADLELSVVLDEIEMTLAEVASIAIGQTIELRNARSGRVQLQADGRSIFWARVEEADGRYLAIVEDPVVDTGFVSEIKIETERL